MAPEAPGPPGPEVIVTPDGSRTALSARFGEAYGSRHGAAAQARHVFVEGSGTHLHPAPRVLEIGFGNGEALRFAAQHDASLDYIGVEVHAPGVGRLLNALAEACEGNQGESAAERTLLSKVEEIIERLVAELNENLAIFMTLEEEFRDFLDPIEPDDFGPG